MVKGNTYVKLENYDLNHLLVMILTTSYFEFDYLWIFLDPSRAKTVSSLETSMFFYFILS